MSAIVTAHSAEDLQQLMTRFSKACRDSPSGHGTKCGFTQHQTSDHELDVFHDFVYLGSTIFDSLALDKVINKRIGKAATTMSSLTKRVWTNDKLTEHIKIQVYRSCALSTLLYAVRPGPYESDRKRSLMRSTCAISIAYCTSPDRRKS